MIGMIRYLILMTVLCLSLLPAWAQDVPKPSLTKVREQVDELNLLKSLIPLRLTVSQIEALLPPMREASRAAVALQKQADDATLALGEEIGKAHAAALGGRPVPESLEKKVAESVRAAAERYQAARRKAVGEILVVAKGKLTKPQKEEIEKQCIAFYGGKRVPSKYRDKPDEAPRDVVLDLAVQGYIEQVLLFDRTLAVLEKMRTELEKQ
jgi:hypothetical protein